MVFKDGLGHHDVMQPLLAELKTELHVIALNRQSRVETIDHPKKLTPHHQTSPCDRWPHRQKAAAPAVHIVPRGQMAVGMFTARAHRRNQTGMLDSAVGIQ
jgi:hypothetical protein